MRRADQALSAAKRGQAGNVRVWEKGSDVELARSLDRLQGIFTGDKSKDYRNMRLLLDTVAAVAASTDPIELACGFTERLFETLRARRVGVVGALAARAASSCWRGSSAWRDGRRRCRVTERTCAVVERACRERDIVTDGGERPASLSLCALPLALPERCLGGDRARGGSARRVPRGLRPAVPRRARLRDGGGARPGPPRRAGARAPARGEGAAGGRGHGPAARPARLAARLPLRRPWSRCWPRPARWRAPTPPC